LYTCDVCELGTGHVVKQLGVVPESEKGGEGMGKGKGKGGEGKGGKGEGWGRVKERGKEEGGRRGELCCILVIFVSWVQGMFLKKSEEEREGRGREGRQGKGGEGGRETGGGLVTELKSSSVNPGEVRKEKEGEERGRRKEEEEAYWQIDNICSLEMEGI
jgi:hypothetical protein